MKSILNLIEKHLGPKLSGVATAVVTAAGQLQTALEVSPVGTTALDLVRFAMENNLPALLPAPIAGIAAYLFRSTNAPEPAPEPRTSFPPDDFPDVDVQPVSRPTVEMVFKRQIEALNTRVDQAEDRVEAMDEGLLLVDSEVNNLKGEVSQLSEKVAAVKPDIDLTENLPLNLRQNNPGNIESTVPGGNKWKGEQKSTNRYAVFETPAHGLRAMMYLLRKVYFQRHGLKTVNDIIHRWAPLGDNSPESVNNYIHHVAGDLKIKPTDILRIDSDDEQLVTMLKSMAEFEGGRPLPYNRSVYQRALELL